MKTISFICPINEVGEKTSKFEFGIRKISGSSWEMLPPVVTLVTPITEEEEEVKVLVTINYDWRFAFPVPQNFEELFGESPNKKFLRDDYISRMRETWGKE